MMKMFEDHRTTMLLGALLIVGCDPASEFEAVEPIDAVAVQAAAPSDGGQLVTTLELEGGARVAFFAFDDGTVMTSEDGASAEPSVLADLAAEHRATPLEIFETLAPERSPPAALVRHHDDHTRDAPRELVRPQWGFRTFTEHEYFADCGAVANGSWFDALVAGTGWPWHWYYSGPLPGWKLSPRRTAPAHISHVCNHSIDEGPDYLVHVIFNGLWDEPSLWSWGIEPGRRHVVYVLGVGEWNSWVHQGQADSPGLYRLGVLQP